MSTAKRDTFPLYCPIFVPGILTNYQRINKILPVLLVLFIPDMTFRFVAVNMWKGK